MPTLEVRWRWWRSGHASRVVVTLDNGCGNGCFCSSNTRFVKFLKPIFIFSRAFHFWVEIKRTNANSVFFFFLSCTHSVRAILSFWWGGFPSGNTSRLILLGYLFVWCTQVEHLERSSGLALDSNSVNTSIFFFTWGSISIWHQNTPMNRWLRLNVHDHGSCWLAHFLQHASDVPRTRWLFYARLPFELWALLKRDVSRSLSRKESGPNIRKMINFIRAQVTVAVIRSSRQVLSTAGVKKPGLYGGGVGGLCWEESQIFDRTTKQWSVGDISRHTSVCSLPPRSACKSHSGVCSLLTLMLLLLAFFFLSTRRSSYTFPRPPAVLLGHDTWATLSTTEQIHSWSPRTGPRSLLSSNDEANEDVHRGVRLAFRLHIPQ